MKNWKNTSNTPKPSTWYGKTYRFLSYIACSGFGVGYFPVASGTAGSLVTLPLAFIIAYYFGALGILYSAIIIFFIGYFASKEVLKYTAHDPAIIIIDEVVGQLLAFIFVGDLLIHNLNAWWIYVVGFVLFRIFDITKPQPAKWADTKLVSAWGVMLDDVFAGLYAGAILYLIKTYTNIL